MAWVYILKTKSGKYYIGSTDDLHSRLRHHWRAHTIHQKLVPESLAFSQRYNSLKEARFIERKIKKLKRKDYVEKIIKDGYIKTAPA